MNKIESFLNALKRIDISKLGPAKAVLEERINVANKLLNNEVITKRTTKAPYYLNDLGVRYSSSPKQFILSILKNESIIIPTADELISDLDEYNVNILADAIDAVVLLTGNFEAVRNIVVKRQEEIIEHGSYVLNIYAGTACAALNDGDNGIIFFKNAIKKSKNILDSLIAKHRLLATILKRKRNFQLFDEIILDIFLNDLHKISEYDKLQITALLNNLLALRHVMDKDYANAIMSDLILLFNSQQLLRESIQQGKELKLDVSESIRYTSQIAVNQAQLLHKLEKHDDATNILKHNLEIVSQNAPEYLSESLGAYSYSLYLSDHFKEAIEYSTKGLIEYCSVGNTRGIDTIRQIRIGSFSKLGDNDNVKREIMFAATDKLGIKEVLNDNN
ncbi:MAG: hypothetical protein LBC17_02260 [Lactobacillaceae bacterium]|nr:hypothetical protein [Lactobacillaceae bacterium]